MTDKVTPHNFTLAAPAEIVFHNLMEPREIVVMGKPTGKTQYDLTIMLAPEHPDLADIRKLVVDIMRADAPTIDLRDRNAWVPPWEAGDAFIERMRAAKGDKAPDNEFMRGKVLLKAHSLKFPPALSLLVEGRGIVDYRDAARATVADKFYPGCQVLAEFNFQPHKVGSNKPGVTAYLNAVVSLNKGERRGGGKSGQERFGAYLGKISAVDPTQGLDAEIAF